MKELKEIVRGFGDATKAGKRTALATVVHVDGSAYRRPGARMLVTEDGDLTGAISGGCLEGDALDKARFAIFQQKKRLVTYDTNDEYDSKLGLGLGCNGVIQVLFEPIDPGSSGNPMEILRAIVSERKEVALATLFSLTDRRNEHPGTCLMATEGFHISTVPHGSALGQALLRDARFALSHQATAFKNYLSKDQNLHALIEYIPPPVSLVILGAGNDVVPLVKMADVLGWQTTVADGRPSYAKPDRFVSACRVLVSRPEKVFDQINIDAETVFVLMTHNYNYDLAMLKELAGRNVRYIGSLGPKKKLERMVGELEQQGLVLSKEQLAHLYGPAGLDIGAQTPEEIALSILAEIRAVLAGKSGQMLRTREVIHSRAETIFEKSIIDA
ncbi:MAG TPA: XdhC/CoxI family protein [Puia sp.]|nr:XdhC/CoxI family protein [Puia sp.]